MQIFVQERMGRSRSEHSMGGRRGRVTNMFAREWELSDPLRVEQPEKFEIGIIARDDICLIPPIPQKRMRASAEIVRKRENSHPSANKATRCFVPEKLGQVRYRPSTKPRYLSLSLFLTLSVVISPRTTARIHPPGESCCDVLYANCFRLQ